MAIPRFTEKPQFRNPWMEFERIRRGLDRLTKEAFGDELHYSSRASVYPPLNIFETPNSLIIRAELPGIKADQLDISLETDTLTIKGKRQIQHEESKVSFHRREIECGNFNRSIGLPIKIDPDSISAKLVNGILTITLNKAEEIQPRRIVITTG